MKPYEIDRHGFLNLFGYTIEGNVRRRKELSQKELHDHAYDYATNRLGGVNTWRMPGIEFLKDVGQPDEIPTKDQFDQWQKKQKVVNAIKDMK